MHWLRTSGPAKKQFRRERGDRGFWRGLTASKDPSTATVLLEDIAALAGVLVALAGVTLNQLLGSPYPDALASAILDNLGKPVHWREAPTDGTAKAAAMLAELLA